MKHGPIALIDEDSRSWSSRRESPPTRRRSGTWRRSAPAAATWPGSAVVSEGDTQAASLADVALTVPLAPPLLAPLVSIIPVQFLAYHVADLKGTDVDQPRNLAKSVTVSGARDDPGGRRSRILAIRRAVRYTSDVPRRGHRLFVALEPTDLVRRRIAAVAGRSSAARRCGPPTRSAGAAENVHLTLQFLGAVPATRVEAVAEAVRAAAGASRRSRSRCAAREGSPNARRPRVVWAGISGDVAALAALVQGLGRRLAPLGFAPETRPYSPTSPSAAPTAGAARKARWRARRSGPGRRGDVARRRARAVRVAPLAEGAALQALVRAAGRRLMGPRASPGRCASCAARPGARDLEVVRPSGPRDSITEPRALRPRPGFLVLRPR